MGGGGREHALAWKLSQSTMLDTLFCAPGNPGISAEPRVTSVADLDIESNAEVSQPLSLSSSLMHTWTYVLMQRCAQLCLCTSRQHETFQTLCSGHLHCMPEKGVP